MNVALVLYCHKVSVKMNANIFWKSERPRGFTWTRVFALTLALIATVLGSKGSAGHRAHLSDDLLRLEAVRSPQKTRVIIHGSRTDLETLARRHGVGIVRWLDGGAVFSANGHDLARLAADDLIDHLSDDPVVQTSMSISNKSTLAAQTRAGSPGLLGIGAIKTKYWTKTGGSHKSIGTMASAASPISVGSLSQEEVRWL